MIKLPQQALYVFSKETESPERVFSCYFLRKESRTVLFLSFKNISVLCWANIVCQIFLQQHYIVYYSLGLAFVSLNQSYRQNSAASARKLSVAGTG